MAQSKRNIDREVRLSLRLSEEEDQKLTELATHGFRSKNDQILLLIVNEYERFKGQEK